MVSHPRAPAGLSLEAFLMRSEDQPRREYVDGKVEAKVSPQKKHGLIQKRLIASLDAFAARSSPPLGESFPELRCTYAGRSIVADVAFLLAEHIRADELGEPVDETLRPPDLYAEVVSPDRSQRRPGERLSHAVANGCALGWLIDPYRRTIDVYRPDMVPIRLADDGVLEGELVLPGYRLTVVEVFGWLKIGR